MDEPHLATVGSTTVGSTTVGSRTSKLKPRAETVNLVMYHVCMSSRKVHLSSAHLVRYGYACALCYYLDPGSNDPVQVPISWPHRTSILHPIIPSSINLPASRLSARRFCAEKRFGLRNEIRRAFALRPWESYRIPYDGLLAFRLSSETQNDPLQQPDPAYQPNAARRAWGRLVDSLLLNSDKVLVPVAQLIHTTQTWRVLM